MQSCFVSLLCDSDSEDEDNTIINPPLISSIITTDEMITVLQPILNTLNRNYQVKIRNFVENVVPLYNEKEFIMHFRLKKTLVEELTQKFNNSEDYQQLKGHGGFEAISAKKQILTFLWFVGHEAASYRDVADRFGITLASLYKVVSRVADFILKMKNDIIKLPDAEVMEKTKQHYWTEKGFPAVIGSIDGCHIRIDKPSKDKDSYINRKHFFSLHMQGIANEKRKFMDVLIGYPGSVHDARVFRESPIYNILPELCSDGSYILGDSAYPCLPYLMVPYRDNGHLTRAQHAFNKRLSSCRISIEHAFGCLKQRFRQLYHFKLRNMERMVKIIHACCVLHNLADLEDLAFLEPPNENISNNEIAPENRLPLQGDIVNIQGRTLRDELCRKLAAQ